ncbi:alpha/beta hydrolase [Streptomyces anulatus]|uniref:alpha/beta hydrolase fold domain-containing protein n=1 Tax=Streptomyces anulatus TaxID=1892 RepID=UPI00403D8B36
MPGESATTAFAHPIDPQLRRTARLYRRIDHGDPLAVRREAARRTRLAQLAGLWTGTDAGVLVRDRVIEHGDGARVPVRIYRPAGATGARPAVLFLHGGAFLSGDLDFEHPRCLEMCRETGFVVVAADYRLAPEHPYPAGLDDCVSVYRWLLGPGAAEGVDASRIVVAGSSAGGALTAALCLRCREEGIPAPVFQMLLYPVTDDRMDTPSMTAFTDTPAWDSRNCVHMWDHYLGRGRAGAVSAYAAPARADDLSGLPPAYVMTAEYDPLRDEGAAYAGRLSAAGVPTELHQFPGAFHAFDTLGRAAVSDRARAEHYAVLRTAVN